MAKGSTIRKMIRFLPYVVKDPGRKPLWKIVYEMIFLSFYYRRLPSFYFSRHLYLRRKTNIRDYLPNKFLYTIPGRLNDAGAAAVLSNKLYFDLFYSRFIPNLPTILCYNYGRRFYRGKQDSLVKNAEDFGSLLHDLVHYRSATKVLFIKKMYESFGGKNTFRLSEKDFPMDSRRLNDLYEGMIHSAYLLQEGIRQHPQMDIMNPSCINTLRMDTFTDREGNCEIISAFLRMSISNSHVDNISSGGCYVGVDVESGKVNKYGYSSISMTDGQIYTKHPVTGTVFEGFQIPFFHEARELVLSAARLVPLLRLIGWDIAITSEGPVLVEGNSRYDLTGHDMIANGYKKNPVFRKILRELNETMFLK